MASHNYDDEHVYAGRALPTPTDTPYRTPSRSLSRQSSQYGTSSPIPSSSPPPLPPDRGRRSPTDSANDEKISIMDPRRFTPTLHASLVSEILSLRRELDSKSGLVESLENNLQSTRNDHDRLDEVFRSNSKETRSLRRQLQLLEGGTSSALGELAKERDEAVENVVELKRRLETSNKRVHAQDNDTKQLLGMWEKDKSTWDDEKRALERKVHVSEGRLQAVVKEVEAHHAAMQPQGEPIHDDRKSEAEDEIGRGSDTASLRPGHRKGLQSLSSLYNEDLSSGRLSTLEGLKAEGEARANGLSLADELAMDEDEDEDDEHEDQLDDELEMEEMEDNVEKEVKSEKKQLEESEAIDDSIKAPGNDEPGLERLSSPLKAGEDMRNGIIASPPSTVSSDGDNELQSAKQKHTYVDTGVQFSPPPSPELLIEGPMEADDNHSDMVDPSSMHIEANHPHKRVATSTLAAGEMEQNVSALSAPDTVSTSSQTSQDLLGQRSPPEILERAPPPPPMVCSSTQTDALEDLQPKPTYVPPIPVPSISIRPPTPGSAIQRKSILAPQTKNAACQASVKLPNVCRSVSVQTEVIRVDRRSPKLPPSLFASAIPPVPTISDSINSAAKPEEPRTSLSSLDSSKKRLKFGQTPAPGSSPPRIPQPEYPGNNDNGLLRSGKTNRIRRPFRSSSLFAGFEAQSSDEADDLEDKNFNDDIYQTGLSAPKPRSKIQLDERSHLADRTIPRSGDCTKEEVAALDESLAKAEAQSQKAITSSHRPVPPSSADDLNSKQQKFKHLNQRLTINTSKQQNIRKSALITSGAAAHTQQARSPKTGDGVKHGSGLVKDPVPPFPVPTRSSSRKPPLSASDGTGSPTYKKGAFTTYNQARRESGRASYKRPSLRKVRSAAAISGSEHQLAPGNRSPPPLSGSTVGFEVPKPPPMPRDEVISPVYIQERHSLNHKHGFSNNTATTADASIVGSGQQTGVVDAIAQTMVGEWMWKYVRRRKSFGVSDSPQVVTDHAKTSEETLSNISSNGVRHKRWVWLAPYERAVMWSSKQPTSGSALLGKSGRKLTIQSVLDVKDETPGPKNAGSQPLFNRSILILTSARALKFTTTSKDRHYLWLMALSFLSDSPSGSNALVPLPPVPQVEYEVSQRPQAAGLRRNPIKDSIRIAKGKARPVSRGNSNAAPSTAGSQPAAIIRELDAQTGLDDPIAAVANPPNIPRFSAHGRKRSNTGSWLPASGFRPNPASNHSFGTNASSDLYGVGSHVGGVGVISGPGSSFSRRTSEVSGRSSVATSNFFDAVGTVRMEAFVQRSTQLTFNEEDEHHGSSSYRVGHHGKWSDNSFDPHHLRFHAPHPEYTDHHLRSDDPFRGF
ncbi:MAG: hypothetical protein M1837_000254 [Sclerophora amabilis]|nr:MAG: hypothetical protein M1837_000254 [Sclerophora amabilis]